MIVLVIAGAYGLGYLLSRLLDHLDPTPRAWTLRDDAICWGLGLWAGSLLALVLGGFGWLRPMPIAMVLAIGSAAALWRIVMVRGTREVTRFGSVERGILGVVFVLSLLILWRSLAPAVAWDAIAYHLALARRFADAHGFIDIPTIRQSRWPQGLDAWFAISESLAGPRPGHWLSGAMAWLLGATGTVGTVALAVSVGGRATAPLAAALFVGAPVVALLHGVAYVDVGMAGLVALAFTAAVSGVASERRADFARAAILAGAAASVKYTGLLCPLLLVVFFMAVGHARPWRRLLGSALLAAIACLPWYARTASLTGNPIWPYGFTWIGGSDWTLEHATRLAAFETGFGTGRSVSSLLLAPIRVTFSPESFDGLPLGYCFLLLAPFAMLARSRLRSAIFVSFTLAVLAWFLSTQQIRFLVPWLPLVIAPIAAGVAAARSRAWRYGGTAVIATQLVLSMWAELPRFADRVEFASGRESRREYLERHLDHHGAVRFINETLKPRRLLLFRETRGYHLEVDYLWGDPLNQAIIDYAALPDPAALHDRLIELAVDAVLLNGGQYPPTPGYYDPATIQLMSRMLQQWGELRYAVGPLQVYSLR